MCSLVWWQVLSSNEVKARQLNKERPSVQVGNIITFRNTCLCPRYTEDSRVLKWTVKRQRSANSTCCLAFSSLQDSISSAKGHLWNSMIFATTETSSRFYNFSAQSALFSKLTFKRWCQYRHFMDSTQENTSKCMNGSHIRLQVSSPKLLNEVWLHLE
jgi:hypothetical protein